jgi:Growth-Arrest-Specific Protein 2 Domain
MNTDYSLEIEIIQLKCPSASDFSKVECILTVNNYTQCCFYPFKTMEIPKVDDYSVLEISIAYLSQVVSGIDIPLTLFKHKKTHTFKLNDYNPDKKKHPSNKPTLPASEITLGIKYTPKNPTIETFKAQIKELELKLRESFHIVNENFKSKKELKDSFEQATENLTKMVQAQDLIVQNLINEKQKIAEYLKVVENDLKAEKTRCGQLEEFVAPGNTNKNNNLYKKSRQTKSIDFIKSKINITTPAKAPYTHPAEGQKQGKAWEVIEKENQNLKSAINELSSSLDYYKSKVTELESYLSQCTNPEALTTPDSPDRMELNPPIRHQSSESVALNLRSEITKLSIKYKSRISKLSSSRNNLIQENKELIKKNNIMEDQIKDMEDQIVTLRREIESLKEQSAYTERANSLRYNPYKPPNKSNKPKNYRNESFNSIYENDVQDCSFAEPENAPDQQKFQEKNQELKNIIKNTVLNKYPIAYTPELNDNLDSALAEFINMHKHSLFISFVREKEGVYQFGSKRVFLKLENGKIYARVGGGFMAIEEFIKIYTSLELDKIQRLKSTKPNGSPLKKITNYQETGKFGIQKRSSSLCKLPIHTNLDIIY